MEEIDIPTEGFRIERICLDYAINFSINSIDNYRELKIESEFTLTNPDSTSQKIDPEHPGHSALAVLALLHRDVKKLVHDGSNLWMDIEGGYRVFVPHDPSYDARTLST